VGALTEAARSSVPRAALAARRRCAPASPGAGESVVTRRFARAMQ
jgi:hypothetical protein